MADGRHFEKTVKSLYLCNRMTDFDKIWYSDAYWPLTADRRLKFRIFEIQMAAVRHLGFVGRLLGPPTTTTLWSLSLCKIWLKSMHETFDILPVWLENAYSRPKNWRFRGISPLKLGAMLTKPPKGTSLREFASFEPSIVKIRRRV